MKKLLLFSLLSGVFMACNKDQSTCKQAICTMEVRSIGLVLRTAQGVIPPSVDYCKTYLNGRLLHTAVGQIEGSACLVHVLDDSHRSRFSLNKAQTIQVQVFQQGIMSKEVNFSILADCCHINRLSGPDTVIVM
ncbi:MAG: hypothetical protein FGM54_01580 [Chitinophagaceae bacterium]|nr:hypothetical protein [Chitinophagaceae bacterium]